MKPRILAFLLSLVTLVGILFLLPLPSRAAEQTAIFTIGSNVYTVNGQQFLMDVTPYTKDGRTFIPLRYAAQALGVTPKNILYDGGKVTLIKGNKVIQLTIGSNVMTVNGTATAMDVAPEVIGGRTMVPFRWMAQVFDARIEWNPERQQVVIRLDDQPATPVSDNQQQKPQAPTGLHLVSISPAGVPNHYVITLGWDPVNNASGYRVYETHSWTPQGPAFIETNTNSYTSTFAGTSWEFYVTAVNSAGESPPSNTISVSAGASVGNRLEAPTGLHLVSITPEISATSQRIIGASVTISWDPVNGATGYRVYTLVSTTESSKWVICGYPTNPTFTIRYPLMVKNNVTEAFYVTAVNQEGEESPPSQTLQVTLPDWNVVGNVNQAASQPSNNQAPKPEAPTGLHVNLSPMSSSGMSGFWVTISWNPVNDAAGYKIYTSDYLDQNGTWTPPHELALCSGNSYSYSYAAFPVSTTLTKIYVTAVNQAGEEGPPSETVQISWTTNNVSYGQSSASKVVVLPPLQYPGGLETIRNTYTWYYEGKQFSWTIEVPQVLVKYEQGQKMIKWPLWYVFAASNPAMWFASLIATGSPITMAQEILNNMLVQDRTSSEYIGCVADRLNRAAEAQGYDVFRKAEFIAAFVQSIPYKIIFPTNTEYPPQVIAHGGDCINKSVLLAAILRKLGYRVAILVYPLPIAHAAVGVAFSVDQIPSDRLTMNLRGYFRGNTNYYFIETTEPGWRIGELSVPETARPAICEIW
ncbi:Copper amine oxidase N-terminal domain-containing protein [Thermanaeromonas toyohensis ToBE]|uniref:Copper amine oxidase N-terminal domain-containing protein n=1 Tax=Thermanaeromonas toyohensis ToBE TaxID=698762 RepID=A0A1W1VTL0_9FIRM|nr:stalk domain-containing protein [Thermanaeromonas toyohensis]SMB96224.1 Copper amine oxidase N-terminal domain-containing protein [Thermanaeromonas toyohensis ToBE]